MRKGEKEGGSKASFSWRTFEHLAFLIYTGNVSKYFNDVFFKSATLKQNYEAMAQGR